MIHSLICRCGIVRGKVSTGTAVRAVCYCADCQTFAKFLGQEEKILNAQGGTEIVANIPDQIEFTAGAEKLACMSLSPHGLYRWYCSECRTPIANIPRDKKFPYVGLVAACLVNGQDVSKHVSSLESAFGERVMTVNTKGAHGKVESTRLSNLLGMARILKNVASARLGGRYKRNPFFIGGSERLVSEPRILSLEERDAVRKQTGA